MFALITTTAGSLNGSSMFFVLFGAVLWIPYAVWWERYRVGAQRRRRAARASAGLTLLTQLWWLMAYSRRRRVRPPDPPGHRDRARDVGRDVGGRGLPRPRATGSSTAPTTRVRASPGSHTPFTQSIVVLAVSFAAPLACVLGGWWSRFRRTASFFVGLAVGGLAHVDGRVRRARPLAGRLGVRVDEPPLGPGAQPPQHPTRRRSLVVLRSRRARHRGAHRAAAVDGTRAGLVAGRSRRGVVLDVLVRRGRRRWSPTRFDRPEAIPQPWVDAAHYLDGSAAGRCSSPASTSRRTAGATPSTRCSPASPTPSWSWRELLPMGVSPARTSSPRSTRASRRAGSTRDRRAGRRVRSA